MSTHSKLAHYYRFALIGSTSSGKTCMLAKLADGRDSNCRFSASRVPLSDFMPEKSKSSDVSKWSEERKLQENFRVGDERLEAAITCLKNLQRPEATSNDGTRPMLRFRLSDGTQRGDFYIWTEDYAGELLKKEGLADPDSQSSHLKNNLLKYDGLIIVVEAAESNSEMTIAHQQIKTLNTFFTALADEEHDSRQNSIPIAIVVTKWDRVSHDIDFENPVTEKEHLELFLKENPMYEEIITSVRSNAQNLPVEQNQDCPTAIIRGNTAVFPVSAFGRSRQDAHGCDFPVDSESFCLVEPFYWLASKCDEIHVAELENAVQKKKTFWPIGFCSLWKKVKRLTPFISKKNCCWERFRKAKQSFNKKRMLYRMMCIILCILFLYGGMLTWNWWYINKIETDMCRPEMTHDKYSQLKEELICYKKSSYFSWPLFVGKKRIDADIQYIEDAVDKLYWTPTDDLSHNAEMSEVYCKNFPNGKHAAEAKKYIEDLAIQHEECVWEKVKTCKELIDKAKAAEAYLVEFNANGHAIHEQDAKQIIEQNNIQIENKEWKLVTNAKPESDEQKKLSQNYLDKFDKDGNARYRTEAFDIIHKADSRAEWDKALRVYNHELNGHDCVKIITKLQELISKYNERCKPLIEDLPKQIMDKMNEKGRTSDNASMLAICDNVKTAAVTLEKQLREKNEKRMADIVLGIIQQVSALREQTIEKYDQALYQVVKSKKNITKCQEYLDKMQSLNGGKMRKEVQCFKDYLEKRAGKLDNIKIQAKIYWTPKAEHYKYKESITIDGIHYKESHQCNSPECEKWEDLGSHIFNGKLLSNSIQIKTYFITSGNWYGNDAVWLDETNSYTIDSLLRGQEIGIFHDNVRLGMIFIKADIPNLHISQHSNKKSR